MSVHHNCSVILRTTNQLSRILVEDFLGPENDPLLFNPAVSCVIVAILNYMFVIAFIAEGFSKRV